MQSIDVSYEADGLAMLGRLAFDDERPGLRAGVLLCHEANGLDEHVKGRAEQLAQLGYVAFALDYHGGGRPLERTAMKQRLHGLRGDAARIRRLARAGLDVLLAHPNVDPDRLAVIGYCFGGTMALELARSGAALRAVVAFHAGLNTTRPAQPGAIDGAVLVCCGADDPVVSGDDRNTFEREMRAAPVADWQLEIYGGVGHSFTNPAIDAVGLAGFAYDERADRRSWQSMLHLFDDRLGPVTSTALDDR